MWSFKNSYILLYEKRRRCWRDSSLKDRKYYEKTLKTSFELTSGTESIISELCRVHNALTMHSIITISGYTFQETTENRNKTSPLNTTQNNGHETLKIQYKLISNVTTKRNEIGISNHAAMILIMMHVNVSNMHLNLHNTCWKINHTFIHIMNELHKIHILTEILHLNYCYLIELIKLNTKQYKYILTKSKTFIWLEPFCENIT